MRNVEPVRWRGILVGTAAAVVGVAGLVLVAATPASAHFLGNDSVDGGEIRWEDNTGWDDARAHAINTWNALGRINIAPDNVTSIADLEWHSVNRSDVNFDGRWVAYGGADHIELNTYYFNGYSTTKRRGVAAHEQGHALGLGHSYSGQLMVDNTPARGNITTPQSHDKADYQSLWG
jgi:hypothetical protein